MNMYKETKRQRTKALVVKNAYKHVWQPHETTKPEYYGSFDIKKNFNVLPLPGGSVSYLDLTGSDQIVDVIESLLHCFTYWHQAMVPKDQHLKQTK